MWCTALQLCLTLAKVKILDLKLEPGRSLLNLFLGISICNGQKWLWKRVHFEPTEVLRDSVRVEAWRSGPTFYEEGHFQEGIGNSTVISIPSQ